MNATTPSLHTNLHSPLTTEQKEAQFRQHVANGNTAAVLLAISEGGINISSSGPSGNTALHYACERDNTEIITALMSAGANIEAVNAKGLRTYDMKGLSHENHLLFKELQFRKNVDAGDIDKVLSTLCERQINISAFGSVSKNTALHLACRRNNMELIMALVNAGADMEAINAEGNHPFAMRGLSAEHQLLLQDVLKSKQALSALGNALEQCKHITSQSDYDNVHIQLLEILEPKMSSYKKNSNDLECLGLVRIKVTLQFLLDKKIFLKSCEHTSIFVAGWLMTQQTSHSIRMIAMYEKNDPNMNHVFIAVNESLENKKLAYPSTLGSQPKAYIVDAHLNESYFSHTDDELFLPFEGDQSALRQFVLSKVNARNWMKTQLLLNQLGSIPTCVNRLKVEEMKYEHFTFQPGSSQNISDEQTTLQNEIKDLSLKLISAMNRGEIKVVHPK